MVSSVEAQATQAGIEMLTAGGNAVDAAVAVGFALAVTHPSAGNLGGGGFMLIGMSGSPVAALDFRERAPETLTQPFFDAMIAQGGRGASAAGVPGTVAGLLRAHERFGSLPRAQVLAPALGLARSGATLGARQAQVLSWAWPTLRRDPEARRLFGAPQGKPLAQGARLIQPELADTLERIAQVGSDGLYAGTVAQQLSAGLRAAGGLVTERDLANYKARWRTPLALDYHNYQVLTMPPPSAGGVALIEMLAMLDALKAESVPFDSTAGVHLFAEVAKRAHADRRFHVVDPDTRDGGQALAPWLKPTHWLSQHPIDPKHATPAASLHKHFAAAMRELDHTTHFSVVDSKGNVVSCTVTLSGSFGAQVIVPGTGIVMNNSLGAFGTVGLDVPKAGRRMTSSMSPTLVYYSGHPVLVLGSPGGDTIPNTVTAVLRGVADYGLSLRAAVDHPRVHHGFVPDALRFEGLRPPPEALIRQLKAMGHHIDRPRRTIGDANVILIAPDGYYGVADSREGGLTAGPQALPPSTRQ